MCRPSRASFALLSLALAAAAAGGCGARGSGGAGSPPEMTLEQEIREWKAKRVQGLTREGGWLSLAGLFWLKEGPNRVGSDPRAEVVLPASVPAQVGTLTRTGVGVTFAPAGGVAVTSGGATLGGEKAVRNDTDEGGP